jgi:hypothetical protein
MRESGDKKPGETVHGMAFPKKRKDFINLPVEIDNGDFSPMVNIHPFL